MNYEDYDEAEKLIGFAYTIKGIDKADILRCKALLCERKEEYSEALEHLKNAERFSYCKEMTAILKERERFIRKKMPKWKKKRRSPRSSFFLHKINQIDHNVMNNL